MTSDLLDRKPRRFRREALILPGWGLPPINLHEPTDEEVIAAIKSVPCHFAGGKFEQTARHGNVSFATANTNRDGSGTLATLITGVATHTRVNKITLQAIVSTTDGAIRGYVHDGTNARMIKEIPVSVVTLSGIYRTPWATEWIPAGGILLPSTSHSLRLSTNNAETFVAIAEGWDF